MFAKFAYVRPLLALASDKVEREDDLTVIHRTAGFAAFGSSTSGYGYSPPSCSGKRQSRARRRLFEKISILNAIVLL